jgi:hypothetical protein
MSSTILTIPFNLKKNTGESQHDKFQIDDILDRYFENKYQPSCFLKIGRVDNKYIKRAIARIVFGKLNELEKNKNDSASSDYHFGCYNQGPGDFFDTNNGSDSLMDKKYLPELGKLVEFAKKGESSGNKKDNFLKHYHAIFDEKLNFYTKNNNSEIAFSIGWVRFIFNRSHLNPSIGYGFIAVKLNWETKGKELSEVLEQHADFLRYIHIKGKKNYFRPKFHGTFGIAEHVIDDDMDAPKKEKKISVKIVREDSNEKPIVYEVPSKDLKVSPLDNKIRIKIPQETHKVACLGHSNSYLAEFYIEKENGGEALCSTQKLNFGIDKWNNYVLQETSKSAYKDEQGINLSGLCINKNHFEKSLDLTFEELFKEIINEFLGKNIKMQDCFELEQEKLLPWPKEIKPNLLHFSVIPKEVIVQHQDRLDDWEKQFDKRVYRLLRIPASDFTSINSSSQIVCIQPDEYVRL